MMLKMPDLTLLMVGKLILKEQFPAIKLVKLKLTTARSFLLVALRTSLKMKSVTISAITERFLACPFLLIGRPTEREDLPSLNLMTMTLLIKLPLNKE